MTALNKHTRRHPLLAAALLCGTTTTFATLAAAAGDVEPPQITVKFADLDVSRPQGAVVLYRRIRAAAETLCSPFDRADVVSKKRLSVCIEDAVAGAITTAHIPALSAVYMARTGKTSHTMAHMAGQRERDLSAL